MLLYFKLFVEIVKVGLRTENIEVFHCYARIWFNVKLINFTENRKITVFYLERRLVYQEISLNFIIVPFGLFILSLTVLVFDNKISYFLEIIEWSKSWYLWYFLIVSLNWGVIGLFHFCELCFCWMRIIFKFGMINFQLFLIVLLLNWKVFTHFGCQMIQRVVHLFVTM